MVQAKNNMKKQGKAFWTEWFEKSLKIVCQPASEKAGFNCLHGLTKNTLLLLYLSASQIQKVLQLMANPMPNKVTKYK